MRPSRSERGLVRRVNARRAVQPGDIVRSGFRAPWRGVVLDVITHKGASDLAIVSVTHDRRGKPLRKPLRKELSTWWLTRLAKEW